MADTAAAHRSLGDKAAFQLANVTKTPPQYGAITPRWLVRLLDWKPLEAGTLRVNRVADDDSVEVVCESDEKNTLPASFANYEEKPREYTLNAISSVLHVSTKISDLYSNPFDQIREQLRLTIESVKERQESELINNAGYGLLKNVPAGQRVKTRSGPPTPDDLDELLTKVWKEPSFFLAHPRAIAAFGRECTRRGVPPATVTMFGAPFLTWRGVTSCTSGRRPRSCSCASERRSRASSGCTSRVFPGSRRRGFRSASWESTRARSPRTSSRSIAPRPC
jgi:hypothetical protein